MRRWQWAYDLRPVTSFLSRVSGFFFSLVLEGHESCLISQTMFFVANLVRFPLSWRTSKHRIQNEQRWVNYCNYRQKDAWGRCLVQHWFNFWTTLWNLKATCWEVWCFRLRLPICNVWVSGTDQHASASISSNPLMVDVSMWSPDADIARHRKGGC